MAENVVLQNVSTLQNSSIVAAINANNAIITAAFADCLSLAGNQPNQMNSNLDMNSFQIINLPSPATLNSPVRIIDLTVSTSSLSPALFALLAGNQTFTGINTFSNTTQSTSTTTGAVIISGGLGIAKNLTIGGTLSITGSFSVATLFGGSAANSTISIVSTSNVSPSGDSTTLRGSTLLFKNTAGSSTFADYNSTTSNAWTFNSNLTVSGNLSVTGSSSTFSFSGSNLGLGTASPVTNAGYATLTVNGSTGGEVFFQTAGSSVASISNSSSTNLVFNTISASGQYLFYVNNVGTKILDYNNTTANAWTFNGSAGVISTGLLRTSSAGSSSNPSLSVGNTTTGFYSVSTTGLGVSVNGALTLDYGISASSIWTFGTSISVPNAGLLIANISTLSRNGGTGAVTINSNASSITLTPAGTTALTLTSSSATFGSALSTITFTGTLTATGNALLNAATGFGVGLQVNGVNILVATSTNFTPGADNTYTIGALAVRWSNIFSVLGTFSGLLTLSGGTLLATSANLTNNAGANAGTLTNAPAAGNPTKWIPINDNGTTRNIPAW